MTGERESSFPPLGGDPVKKGGDLLMVSGGRGKGSQPFIEKGDR